MNYAPFIIQEQQVVVLAKEGLFANLQFQEYVVAPLCIVSDIRAYLA